MAKTEPMLNNGATPEMTAHLRDYSRFITMFKWGAIICALIGLIVLMIIS